MNRIDYFDFMGVCSSDALKNGTITQEEQDLLSLCAGMHACGSGFDLCPKAIREARAIVIRVRGVGA